MLHVLRDVRATESPGTCTILARGIDGSATCTNVGVAAISSCRPHVQGCARIKECTSLIEVQCHDGILWMMCLVHHNIRVYVRATVIARSQSEFKFILKNNISATKQTATKPSKCGSFVQNHEAIILVVILVLILVQRFYVFPPCCTKVVEAGHIKCPSSPYSQTSLLSKLLRHIANAWIADIGY